MPEEGLELELRHEEGGYRHYLDGRPVHAGTSLELLTDDGWVLGRYEWSYNSESRPFLIANTDTDEAATLDDRLFFAGPSSVQ